MEENCGIEDASRQDSLPVLVGLPVRTHCPWTLEPEHAVNIRGGQVCKMFSGKPGLYTAACYRDFTPSSLHTLDCPSASLLSFLRCA